MPIYELGVNSIRAVPTTQFSTAGVQERAGLQRLLRERIDVVAQDTLVIAEEFGYWDDSKRRIDLLAIDKDANLVVIELKRTEDGGHMELQAIRYAAMVSTMTFDQAVAARETYQRENQIDGDPEQAILEFLGWDEANEDDFGQAVRIVLVSADFSKELTTAVIWLNNHDLDIRCVRLKPYQLNGQTLLDVQQVIPLPEAADFMVKVRRKEQDQRKGRDRSAFRSMEQIWQAFEENCPPEEVAAAREIHDWLVPRVKLVFPTRVGFVAYSHGERAGNYMFRVGSKGRVQIWYYCLLRKPPFTDETLRLEFTKRLNQIPGVDLPHENLSGKPAFPLATLVSPEARGLFLEAVDWMLQQMELAEQQGSADG